MTIPYLLSFDPGTCGLVHGWYHSLSSWMSPAFWKLPASKASWRVVDRPEKQNLLRWSDALLRMLAVPLVISYHFISFPQPKNPGLIYTDWWVGTCFIFPYIGKNHPNWLIFFRGLKPPTSTALQRRNSKTLGWESMPWTAPSKP